MELNYKFYWKGVEMRRNIIWINKNNVGKLRINWNGKDKYIIWINKNNVRKLRLF